MRLEFNNPRYKLRRKELRLNSTQEEKILWNALRAKKLNNLKFHRQYSIGPYILDFYCPNKKIAVELDGNHHLTKDNQVYDKQRTLYLETKEIIVIRFKNSEINLNLEKVLKEINTVLIEASPS